MGKEGKTREKKGEVGGVVVASCLSACQDIFLSSLIPHFYSVFVFSVNYLFYGIVHAFIFVFLMFVLFSFFLLSLPLLLLFLLFFLSLFFIYLFFTLVFFYFIFLFHCFLCC